MVGSILALAISTLLVTPNQDIEPTFINQEYVEICEEMEERYGICSELLVALIEKESSGNAEAVNSAGTHIGLCQLSEHYFGSGVDLTEPYTNIEIATEYLVSLADEYEDVSIVLMRYNGTPESKAYELADNGTATEYAKWILNRSADLEKLNEQSNNGEHALLFFTNEKENEQMEQREDLIFRQKNEQKLELNFFTKKKAWTSASRDFDVIISVNKYKDRDDRITIRFNDKCYEKITKTSHIVIAPHGNRLYFAEAESRTGWKVSDCNTENASALCYISVPEIVSVLKADYIGDYQLMRDINGYYIEKVVK